MLFCLFVVVVVSCFGLFCFFLFVYLFVIFIYVSTHLTPFIDGHMAT